MTESVVIPSQVTAQQVYSYVSSLVRLYYGIGVL